MGSKSKFDYFLHALFLIILLVVLLFLSFVIINIVVGVDSIGKFFYDYGSFMAGVIALFAALITLRYQKDQFVKGALEAERRDSLRLLGEIKSVAHDLSDLRLDTYCPISVKLMKEMMVSSDDMHEIFCMEMAAGKISRGYHLYGGAHVNLLKGSRHDDTVFSIAWTSLSTKVLRDLMISVRRIDELGINLKQKNKGGRSKAK